MMRINANTPISQETATSCFFDEVTERRASNSMKWAFAKKFLSSDEVAADPLPMWVADMDFKSPPAVTEALHAAVEHGVFGYPGGPTKSYLGAVIGWQNRRFGWNIEEDWVVLSSGIITALKVVIQAFSAPGDTVLIQPPVYVHFHSDVLLNGRRLTCAPLKLVDGRYIFDATEFEAAISDNTKLFILSNPHNPTGNVWTENELRTMGEICARRGVLVISDEIHEDLVMNPEKTHIPFASLSETFAQNSITCTAPSKTFNLAGLQCANVIIPNKRIREEFSRQYDRNMFRLINVFGMIATEAAYTHGEVWMENMVSYVRQNHALFANSVNAMTPKIKVLSADSLYLAWVDCRDLEMDTVRLEKFMLTKARLWLDKGPKFGIEGHGFMRVNLGCPRSVVEEALRRLSEAISLV